VAVQAAIQMELPMAPLAASVERAARLAQAARLQLQAPQPVRSTVPYRALMPVEVTVVMQELVAEVVILQTARA
jgi:hypothetical protein